MADVARLDAEAPPSRRWANTLVVTAVAALSGWVIGWIGIQVAGDAQPEWLLGRLSGVAALVMLTALVSLGLALAHPRGSLGRRFPRMTLLRLHVGLAAFTAVFIVLHVLVLALDQYAGVGWQGVLLPLGAQYRPLPVTLGWLALYAGAAAGLTAHFAGVVGRAWFPIHRVSIATFALVWLHGVFAGSDTHALIPLYAGCGVLVGGIAVSRYTNAPIRTTHHGAAR